MHEKGTETNICLTKGVTAASALRAASKLALEPKWFEPEWLRTLSITMTMIARPVGSLCTHGLILLEGWSAWAIAHSLLV